MKDLLRRIVGTLLLAGGIALFLYPSAASYLLEKRTEIYIRTFEAEYGKDDTESAAEGPQTSGEDSLYRSCLQYNDALFAHRRQCFTDPWSFAQVPGGMTGWEHEGFGYINIPAMEVKLPLYVGATAEHMAKGAAVLGQTSMPVGGENTNCVIAGHRGYRGVPFFRDIEKLQRGDTVIIRSRWETLVYCVESMEVIDPYDSDKVTIQPGRDMVTLLTCHPYRSRGKYRYVVYCVRDGRQRAKGQTALPGDDTAKEGGIVSSVPDIERERLVRLTGGLTILFVMCMVIVKYRKKERKQS